MLDALRLIADFILDQFDQIWLLYTGSAVLGLTILLWILDRLFHIFDILKR